MTAAILERSGSAQRRATRGGPATSRGRSTGRRPALRVLDQEAARRRARRRNALFTLFVVVLAGFFAVAFVHAELVAGQQRLDDVRARIAEAEAHRATVARATDEAAAPAVIVARAEALGMVRAHRPVYLEAVAPLRDVAPAAPLGSAASRSGIDLIAAPATGQPALAAGISASATVDRAAPQLAAPGPSAQIAPSDAATPSPATAPTEAATQAAAPPPAATAAPGSGFGGISVSTAPATGAAAGAAAVAAPTGSSGDSTTVSSIAGTRAVSTGVSTAGTGSPGRGQSGG